MPVLLTEIPETPNPALPPRKRWTRDQCATLEASGLFEVERLELVNGELISKMGKNRPHVIALMSTMVWLLKTFGDQFVDSEAPIDVHPADNSASEPEPDIIVLTRERTSFQRNPNPSEISLLVEIADSSLSFDLTVKRSLYARAGIREYWVLDVNGRQLFVHRNPADGQYSAVVVYGEYEYLAPLAAPEVQFTPKTVLPPTV